MSTDSPHVLPFYAFYKFRAWLYYQKIIMTRHILLSTVLLITSLTSAVAQKLTSPEATIDCGQVLFQKPHTVTFTVKNTTSRSVTVKKVETSCGCTTALASKRHIAANKEITVQATFDAKQLGHFQKDIYVYDGDKTPLVLTMKGIVVASIKDYSATYPCLIGQIRADRNDIEFDNVNKGAAPTQTMHILNTTGETIEPVIMHMPDYIKAQVIPEKLTPEQSGEIIYILDSEKLPRMGLSQTTLYLGKYPGDKVAQAKEINVSAILLPSFDNNAANSSSAPHIQLSSNSFDRSTMSGKPENKKGEIIVQNVGNSTLNISSMQMFTGGMQVSLGKTVLEPSESTKLKVQLDENALKKINKRPRILMITNDPSNPKVIIEIN